MNIMSINTDFHLPSLACPSPVPLSERQLDRALIQLEKKTEALQAGQRNILTLSYVERLLSYLEAATHAMKDPSTPLDHLQGRLNDLTAIERALEDHLDLVQKILESEGESALGPQFLPLFQQIQKRLPHLEEAPQTNSVYETLAHPTHTLQRACKALLHPLQTASSLFHSTLNLFSMESQAQGVRERFFHKARYLYRYLQQIHIQPQEDKGKQLALQREIDQIRLSEKRAKKQTPSRLKGLIFLVLQTSHAALQAAQKPSLDQVYQKAVHRAHSMKTKPALEREIRFLKAALYHKREALCQMPPDAFDRFTIRYAQARERLHLVCQQPIAAEEIEPLLEGYRTDQTGFQLLPMKPWMRAFLTLQTLTTDSPFFDLEDLQKQMEDVPKPKRFCLDPPLPKSSYAINQTAAQEWIERHSVSPRAKQLAEKIVREIRHIPYELFELNLAASVEDLNQKLSLRQNQKYTITMSETTKSGYWVTQLAMKYLKYPPQQIKEDAFLSFPNDFPVVIFDDAIYSGLQIKKTLERIQHPISNLDYPLGYVVAPYIADKGERPLKMQKDPAWIYAQHETMPTVKELFSEGELKSLNWRHALGRTTVYFDHKMADTLSFCCENISQGYSLPIEGLAGLSAPWIEQPPKVY